MDVKILDPTNDEMVCTLCGSKELQCNVWRVIDPECKAEIFYACKVCKIIGTMRYTLQRHIPKEKQVAKSNLNEKYNNTINKETPEPASELQQAITKLEEIRKKATECLSLVSTKCSRIVGHLPVDKDVSDEKEALTDIGRINISTRDIERIIATIELEVSRL